MDRRVFIKNTGFIGSGIILTGSSSLNIIHQQKPSLQPGEAFRWAQLVFVENDPGHYDRWFIPNNLRFAVQGEPLVMNQRLVAQSATFVVPGVLDQPVERIIESYRSPEKTLAKIVLDTDRIRDDAMFSLYSMNITNATLFPGLDGMARSLAFELEHHWEYNPKTLDVHPDFLIQERGPKPIKRSSPA